MFLIENGYLKQNGFSFKFPNGLYLQTDSDTTSEHEVHFLFKEALHIIISIDPYDGDITEDLEEDIKNGTAEIIHDITTVEINGLKAQYAIFLGLRYQVFVMNFEPKLSKHTKKLKIIGEVFTKSGFNIIDLLKEKEIKEFIESISMI